MGAAQLRLSPLCFFLLAGAHSQPGTVDLGLEEQATELLSLSEREGAKQDFRTCLPPSNSDYCQQVFDCRKLDQDSACSSGVCDLNSGMCRCPDSYGGCDCSVHCPSLMAGCRKCSADRCLICTAPEYFVCPGTDQCHLFCKNNCNGHKCDEETGKCACDSGWGGDDCSDSCAQLDPHCTSCTAGRCKACDADTGFNVEPLCGKCKRHTCDCKGHGVCSCDAKCKCFNGFGGPSCEYSCHTIQKGCVGCYQDEKDSSWHCNRCDKVDFKATPRQEAVGSVCDPACPVGQSMKDGRCASCGIISKFKLGSSCSTDARDLCLTRATSKAQDIKQAGNTQIRVSLALCESADIKEASVETKEAAANQMWLKRPIKVKLGKPQKVGWSQKVAESREVQEFYMLTVPDDWLTASTMLAKNDQFVKPTGEEYCLTSVINPENGEATAELTVQICEVKNELSSVRHLQLWTANTSRCEDKGGITDGSFNSREVNSFILKKNNQTFSPTGGNEAAANAAVTLQKMETVQKWTAFDVQAIPGCKL